MFLEYSVIDLRTGLVSGPYPSFNEARSRVNNFTGWEIARDDNEAVLDWREPIVAARRPVTSRMPCHGKR
jgi:hypothetical protein